ncbi:YcxB family protein [Streptomyces sp. NBC_00893]|uniref:YcxB family protein n=1 Tax=Streptomyces sp. NBC_00893 TaxID=2975862 RepID=UPI002250FC3C|nr:YcxB family protein [Streptomyces sp. NBC_00893]MCX4848124.1 YcxB family protein [Streptomyces sp. NBC_00893]
MTTQGWELEGAVVELEYQPTTADFAEALNARAKISRSGRMQRKLLILMPALAVLMGITIASGRHGPGAPVWVGLVFVMLAVVLTPWLQGRQLYRFAVRQGTCRTVVRETGVEVATDHSTMIVRWPMVPRYRETPQLFVLFSGDKQATGITMLPKRGVRGPEDLDRLRSVLDRNVQRL